MFNIDLFEAWDELNNIYEDAENGIPAEVLELVSQGVPVLEDEPDFIEDEVEPLQESSRFHGLKHHFNSHVARTAQNLFELQNTIPNGPSYYVDGRNFYGYRFSRSLYKEGEDAYNKMAEDLASSELGSGVKAFICQATKKVDKYDSHSSTKKLSTGLAGRNKNSAFRICKYRLNKNLNISADDLFYLRDGKKEPVVTDFNFAENNIYEVVYYTFDSDSNYIILSYFLKHKDLVEKDLASAKSAFKSADDGDKSLSRQATRYSNQVDVEKDVELINRQPVPIVLSLVVNRYNIAIQADLYSSINAAQTAYSNNNRAFLVCMYYGTKDFRLLKGKESYERDRSLYLKPYTSVEYKGVSALVDRILVRISSIIDDEEYLGAATNQDILNILTKAVDRAEFNYVSNKANWQRNRYDDSKLYKPKSWDLYVNGGDNVLLASVIVS